MPGSFKNDYSVLAHPRILEALSRYGNEYNVPYGLDVHSKAAEKMILETFGAKGGEVHFLAGGTQTNLVLISFALKPYEAVIAASSGHINVHETAAVEGTGHKILTAPGKDGKIYPKDIEGILASCPDEHTVKPRMVYISDSTETGTIYTKKELLDLRACCDKNNLLLFIDGARLGAALMSKDGDVPPALIGEVSDAFYVGGAKNGLLLGEALVLVSPSLREDFRRHIKNRGAMLAKGYLIGIQFEEAFRDGFYFELARRTNYMAELLKNGLLELGLDVAPSPTNQLFVTVKEEVGKVFIEEFGCELWAREEGKLVVRFVTSFATKSDDVKGALNTIKALKKKYSF